MITILSQPSEIVFSRNPCWFKLQTDNLFETVGQVGRFYLSFPSGPLSDGDTFSLDYPLLQQSFVISDSPDTSGIQLRSGTALTLSEWCDQLIEDFAKNYGFSTEFIISKDLTGPDPRLLFVTKKKDTDYTLSVNEQDFVSLEQIQPVIKQLRRPNFRLSIDLYIENATHTDFIQAGTTQFSDVNDAGQAWFNASKTLTQILVADGFDAQDPALPALQRNRKGSRRYYLRIAEAYGLTQTIKSVNNTDIKWAVLGGAGKIKGLIDIPSTFSVDGELKFLKHQPIDIAVKQNQPEWLSLIFVNNPPAVVRLRCNILYTDETTATFFIYSLNDVVKYDKITYPAGCTQLGVHQVNPAKVVEKYELYIEDGDSTRITEKRIFWLDYRVHLFIKYAIALSSLGAYDTQVTYGKNSTEYTYQSELSEIPRSIDFEFATGEIFEFDTNITEKISVASGVISRRELLRFRDFFLSWDKYIIRNNKLVPILLSSKSIRERKDGNNRYALEFEYSPRFSEDLYSEDEEEIFSPLGNLSNYLPPAVVEEPLNFDDRYYLKSQTYNQSEINAFFTDLLAAQEIIHEAMQDDIDDIIAALNGKANTNHAHPDLVTYIVFNEFADAVTRALIYKGEFDPDYTVDPDDDEQLPGYLLNDIVDFAGSLWRSLFGDLEDDLNTAIPGTDPAKWEKIIEAKTQLSITEPVTLNWQAGLIPGKTYTWAQKYGNDLPGTAGAWWDNGTKWERFEGFQMDPTYDGANLLTVAITADLYPVKINLI